MTNNPIFKGVATALITPLSEKGVDYQSFERIINWQIEEGINALVIAGTTGEGSTLTDQEHREVLAFAAKVTAGRVPLIAGTGSNDTAYAIELTKYACEIGYDAMLLVTPYYNKATQNGLVAMYKAIADASTKPCILYNVPSRTGVNIEPSTYQMMAGYPKLTAVKEANGNLSKIIETFSLVGNDMDIYSGNDDQIFSFLSLGGSGVISVLSNVAPKATVEMCQKFFSGDYAGARQMQLEYLPLINALFSEVNPIPVKAAMAKLGWCDNYVRLPLTPMEQAHADKLFAIMKEKGLL